MLTRSFIFLRGVGEREERHFWAQGIYSWDALLDALPELPVHPRRKSVWIRQIAAAEHALREMDISWLARNFPATERWRLIPDLWSVTAFVDVEAYQIRPGQYRMTIAGVLFRNAYHSFLAGRNLSALSRLLADARLMVSFGGQGFDLQMIRQTFPHWQLPFLHIDLQPLYRRAGLPEGLKKLERMFGWKRGAGLDGLGGWIAVQLWEWHQEGDDRALQALIRYNFEDVIHLPELAVFIYNELAEQLRCPFPRFHPPLPRLRPPDVDRSIIAELHRRRSRYVRSGTKTRQEGHR